MFVTFQHKLDIVDESPPVVPVDLVTIADKTNIKTTVAPAPKVLPTPAPQPPVEQPPPQVQPQPAPTPPQQQPPPDEEPPPDAQSEPVLKPPPPPPAPIVRPRPPQPPQTQAKEKPKEKFDVNKVLAMLDKTSPEKAAPNAAPARQTHRGIGQMNVMTMDLVDALRNQVAQCWSPPQGAPDSTDLVVDFDLFLNPDGTVARQPQLVGESASRAQRSPYARAAARAARRAIMVCAPYKLPQDRYSQWKEINPFHFDPRGIENQ